MANFKGSGILVLGKLMKSKGGTAEARFLAALTPAETKIFKTTLPTSWVPAQTAVSISVKAADILYPGELMRRRLFLLGQDRALQQITGVYKLLFRMLNVSTVLSQAATLWRAQHDEGEARVEKNPHANQAAFCVANYPALLPEFRVIVQGFIYGIMGAAGAKNIQIILEESNPNLWKWSGSWV